MHLRALLVGLLALSACASEPPPVALQNRTFYQYDDQQPSGSRENAFETPFPPLDKKADGKLPEYIGVSVLGTIHLSRPANWKIRRASLTAERRFVEYVSPNEYLFAIYERIDPPGDPWFAVLDRYEAEAKTKGAALLGSRIPVATAKNQGREYVVRRTIKGQRAPYANVSSEILLRSDTRVDLVEIVHQGSSIAPIGDELLRVMETLEIL